MNSALPDHLDLADIPADLLRKANEIDQWMQTHGHERWQLGPIASRKLVPAASSLPPSDGGGADWADRAAEEIADLPDACLHIDESGSNGMGWHCKRLPESDLAAIILKHAPTQQPAAGGKLLSVALPYLEEHQDTSTGQSERLRNLIAAVCTYIDKAELDEVMNRNAVQGLKDDLTHIITKEAATPRPESPDAQRGEPPFMLIKLGNGNIEMGAVRLSNGNWAVLLQTHDQQHAIGEHANNAGQNYVPTDRDVVIEIGNVDSGRVLQDAVNHTLLFATGLVKFIPTADPK